jgi:NADPH-dependent ferric siderophore reductase
MLRNHPDIEAHVVVEIDRPEDALVLPGAVRWQYRHGAPAAGSASLLETVRHLELPAEPGVAYLAGEARTIQTIRSYLVSERQWPRRSVLTKPFWTPGRPGLG